jgi:histidinol phosphatase-like enzyme
MVKVNLPLDVVAATKKDTNRKPDVGMFQYFLQSYNLEVVEEHHNSFFVGDAAGRPAAEGNLYFSHCVTLNDLKWLIIANYLNR